MSKRRSNPALFELLGGEQPEPALEDASDQAPSASPTSPAERLTSGVIEKPDRSTEGTVPDRSLPAETPAIQGKTSSAPTQTKSELPETQTTKSVRINTLTLAYLATWTLVILVVGWVAGFQSGQSEANAAWERANEIPTFEDSGEVPFDPLLLDEQRSLEPEPIERSLPAGGPQTATNDGSSDAQSRQQANAADTERRTPGLNYLALGTLDAREEAERLVGFLEAEGMPAQMIRVRTRSGQSWQVLTLTGITGREYGRNAPVRRDHEDEVTALGRRWLKDMDGTLDFTVPARRQWTKHDP